MKVKKNNISNIKLAHYIELTGRVLLSKSLKYGCCKAAFAEILLLGSYTNVFWKKKSIGFIANKIFLYVRL